MGRVSRVSRVSRDGRDGCVGRVGLAEYDAGGRRRRNVSRMKLKMRAVKREWCV